MTRKMEIFFNNHSRVINIHVLLNVEYLNGYLLSVNRLAMNYAETVQKILKILHPLFLLT